MARQKRHRDKTERNIRDHIIKSSYKCSICGEWIHYPSRRSHLRKRHNIIVENPKPYFISKKQIWEEESEKRWKKYCKEELYPDLEKKKKYRCGEKVNGVPFMRIIYTSLESNRRKH